MAEMRVNSNHRLIKGDGAAVSFQNTPHKGGTFAAGKPTFLIIHYTSAGPASGSISWFKDPKSKASAHLVIDRDGSITQMVNLNVVAWHAGVSSWKNPEGGNRIVGLNQYAVGIELANWGLLKKQPSGWATRTGRPITGDRVLVAKHKNFEPTREHGWEIYPEAQLDACLAAAKAILEKYEIPVKNVLGHDDISPGRKQDPGPAFDLNEFRSLLAGGEADSDDLFKVEAGVELNLRMGPGTEFEVMEKLKPGALVRRIGVDGQWYEVAVLNEAGAIRETGWCHSGFLDEV